MRLLIKVNGVQMRGAFLRDCGGSREIVVRDSMLGWFAVDDRFLFEISYDAISPEVRTKLPGQGWHQVKPRVVKLLLNNMGGEGWM